MRRADDEDFFSIDEYRAAMRFLLSPREGSRPRGAVKKLATSLKCHSTFIAHVLNHKADLSTEQALRLCRHFNLEADETAYFLDLVHRDRAGDTYSKSYFDGLLKQRREDRQNLKKRIKATDSLTPSQEATYYRSWLSPAIHILCQLPGRHSIDDLAENLSVSRRAVEKATADLVWLGVLVADRGGFRSARDSIHLGKDSPMINRSHYNWRIKTAENLDQMSFSQPGLHYSAVVSLSEADAQRLREVILKHIEATRRIILPSPAEQLYVQCLDFYRLTP